MSIKSNRFELSIDNDVLQEAKRAMNTCLQIATRKAIATGSMECSVSLKISLEMEEAVDHETGETFISPKIDYKSNYTVPLKDSVDGKVIGAYRLIQGEGGAYSLYDSQISMDELIEGSEPA